VAEVVSRYPVDGVQFDDYFYTETAGSALNDGETFRKYGQGFASKADWRRHNTQQLIEQVSRTIKQINPNVEFGVSPAGYGVTALSTRQVPTRVVLLPMMSLSPIPAVGYSKVCWITSLRSCTGRFPVTQRVMMCWQNGGPMSLNQPIPVSILALRCIKWANLHQEPDWSVNGGVPELKKQLDLNESTPQIKGTILFREDYLNQPQTQQAVNYLKSRWGN
jgi:uncharacterized lipoprotein YddW (UPF0748 family)